ncbi:MAG: phosphoenolpyruvate--protein phosphotransferase [Treponema sp.]|jgi:phosphotransferase system enzyme I (PtsI)|nr:phosphoenolpyruvate--protein phosphotransferase [Treponema sp.]
MKLQGKSAAPGVAVGSIFIHSNYIKQPKETIIPAGEVDSHLNQYLSVKKEALKELEKLQLSAGKKDPKKAVIFIAHKEIVEDVIINEEIPAKIKNEHWSGDWAICQVYETVLSVLKKTPDPLISERASDFEDVRTLLLRLWYGSKNSGLGNLKEPVIIAAKELLPSDAVNMEKDKVLAILTETGGLTSHAAIIAKGYGIPIILGIPGFLEKAKHGQLAVVDANEGIVILDPDSSSVEEYKKKADAFLQDKKDIETYLDKECYTACAVKIDIGLNISNTDEDLAAAQYADSVGVFRTEFLYMEKDILPSEDEQFIHYSKVLECFGDRPVIIRTMDIGGDKNVPCMTMPREDNPFLGNRALRLCFSNPGIFTTQIRALLRAAVQGNLWLMLPMVASINDIRKAKEFISSAAAELKKEGKPFGKIKIGIMIEIPSIAIMADLAAKEVDFASIGTNDLCQYLCAADRMNSEVEDYYDPYHPAHIKLIKEVITAFNSEGKPISVCGEFGSDLMAIPLLIGLGLHKLSMNASAIPAVKRVIAGCIVKDCESLAERVLACITADEVKAVLLGYSKSRMHDA